jgi:hypothetical protein
MMSACFLSRAQNLPGKIYDSASRQPLSYVTIHLMKSDRTPVRTVVSDSSGNFILAFDTGRYILLYTCAGYHPFLSNEIAIAGQQANALADVYLRRDTSQLAAVTVFGRKPIIEPSADGFIYNAENDVVIAAGTAIDVLRKIPLLSITPDGSPSIRGSTNVRVFIDNKPSNVFASSIGEALQQVPSEEIARVEIITHPSARYDAEGTDAVINIITKKRRYDGYNGNLRAYFGNWQQEISGTYKLRSGYWIMNLDGYLSRSTYEGGYTLHRSANRDETSNRFQQQREWSSSQNVQLITFTLLRIIDSLNTLNFNYRYRGSGGKETALLQTQLYSADTINDAFTREIPSTTWNGVHTITGAWSGQSRNKKKEFNFLAVYFAHEGGDKYDLQQLRDQVVNYREKSDGETGNRELSLQGDYVQNVSKLSKLEAGIKTTWRSTRSQNLFDIYNYSQNKFLRDEHRSNNFSYQRDVYAGYASYSLAVKKWQSRAGMRFEQTRLFTQFKDTALQIPNYNNWLPNFLSRYTFNKTQSLAYSYTTRIARPYISYLNPNINYIDSFNISYGNPNLLPEIAHIHTLDYNFNKRSIFINVSLVYRRLRQSFEEIRIQRPDKVTESTPRNIGRADNWALNFIFRYNPNNKLNLGNTITVQYVTRNSPALNLEKSGFLAQYSFNGSYRFGKGFALESYVYYESRSINLQTTRTDYLFYNLLLTKTLLNDKLNITFRMDGFLDPWFYRTTEIENSSFYQATTYRSVNRYLRLAISWKFGKQDLRTPASRTAESND